MFQKSFLQILSYFMHLQVTAFSRICFALNHIDLTYLFIKCNATQECFDIFGINDCVHVATNGLNSSRPVCEVISNNTVHQS